MTALNIPAHVLCSVFLEYLRVDDLCRLDSAICNKLCRPHFVEYIGSGFVTSKGNSVSLGGPQHIGVNYLLWLHKRKIRVQSLNLRQCKTVAAVSLIADLVFMRLIILVINKYEVKDDTALLRLPPYLPKLEALHLTNSPHITDKILREFCRYCFKVTVLSITGCTHVTDQGILVIAQSYGNRLRKVNLCKTFNTVNGLTNTALRHLSDHCPNLSYLNISLCAAATDADMNMLCTRCPHLKELSLLGCQGLQEYTVTSLANNCTKLCALDACCCYFLDDEVELLTKQCRDICRLSLSQNIMLSDVGVSHIAKNCSRIHTLYLAGCKNITDVAIIELARARSTGLLELNLSRSSQLTNKSIHAICEHCPSLTRLNISSCTRMDNFALIHMRNTLPALKELICSTCFMCLGMAVLQWYRPRLLLTSL